MREAETVGPGVGLAVKRFLMPDGISLAIATVGMLIVLGTTYGNAIARVSRVEQEIVEIQTQGTVPTARVEQELKDMRLILEELRSDVKAMIKTGDK